MIGLVVVEAPPGVTPELAGLRVPLRALLALQAAGATALGVAGTYADAWLPVVRADDRIRVSVEVFRLPPAEAHVAVDGAVVIDNRAARALVARPGVVFSGGIVAAVHRAARSPAVPERAFLDDGGEGALAIGDGIVARVRDGESAWAARDLLLAGLRKPEDGIVARAVNRPLSLAVTRVLCGTGLRPNVVSVAILGVGLAGAALAARGSWGLMALGALLFQTQSVLDGCDGELARLTYRGSRAGEWLDTVGDDLTNYGFFAGAAAGLHRAGLGSAPILLGGVGLAAGVLASLIEYRYLLRIGSGDLLKYPLGFGQDPGAPPPSEATGVARLLGLARPFFKRDFFVLATLCAAVAGPLAMLLMLGLFAAGAVATLGAVLRSEWIRRGKVPAP